MHNINRTHSENVHKNVILELNGLRGFACLLIFLFHCRIMSGSPDIRLDLGFLYLLPLHGAYAVDLFFVLSGFFVILPYAKAGSQGKKPFSFFRYYKKKFVRIFPAYYINLAVMFGIVVPIFIGGDYLLSKSGLKMLLAHMSFLHYLHPSTSASLGINGALWTLSITFQFFLIFPFIKNLFTGGNEKKYLLVFILLSVAWKFLSYYHTGFLFNLAMDSVKQFGVDAFTIRFFLSNQLPAQLGHFAIGMYLGNRYIAHKNGLEKSHPWSRLIALTGFVSTVYSFHIANLGVPPWWHFWRLWLAFGSGCLIYLAAIDGPRLMRSFFSNRYLGYLGNLSYEIYLWHLMVLYVITKIPLVQYIHGNHLFWFCFFVGGAITLWICHASITYISATAGLLTGKPDSRKPSQEAGS